MWKTIYPSKHIEEYIYERDNREELVKKYHSKYGKDYVSTRIGNRRNITNSIKNAINIVVNELISSCPYQTGNGRLNGIRYMMSSGRSGVITVGDPSAPYLVHLSNGKRYNRYLNWINGALAKANFKLERLNNLIGQDRIYMNLNPDLSYGLAVIRVYTL